MRLTRAYMAGFGTAGSLLAGASVLFVMATAVVSYRGWPQVANAGTTPTVNLRASANPVIAGTAGQQELCLKKKRINLGRLVEVIDADGRLTRKNDVAFRDDAPAPNPTVSRAHAHIEFDPDKAVFRLFDDRSAHGTTVIRDGSVIPVPQGPSKGVALEHGDEIVLGEAHLGFEEGAAEP